MKNDQFQTISTKKMSNKLTSQADSDIKSFTPSSQKNTLGLTVTPSRSTTNTKTSTAPTSDSFFSGAKGLSLKQPSTMAVKDMQEYDAGNMKEEFYKPAPYDVQENSDSFLKRLMSENSNKMIGAMPKLKDTMELPAAGSGESLVKETGSRFGKEDLTAVGQFASDTLQTLENQSVDKYKDDMNYFLAQGKFWFDPNSELKPDLDGYISQMPSAVDSLKEAGMNSIQKGNTDTVGEAAYNVLLNPAALKVKNKALQTVLNPLALFDKKMGDGFSGYVGSQAAKGAMGGGVIGAAIGVIKGIFTWGSAKKEDQANETRLRQEYEQKLKQWTINKNKRILASKQKQAEIQRQAFENMTIKNENKKAIADQKRTSAQISKRNVMKDVLSSAGSNNRTYRQRRLANNQAS